MAVGFSILPIAVIVLVAIIVSLVALFWPRKKD